VAKGKEAPPRNPHGTRTPTPSLAATPSGLPASYKCAAPRQALGNPATPTVRRTGLRHADDSLNWRLRKTINPASLFVAPHLASLVQDAGLAHEVARLVQWKRQRVQRQQVQW
jgi:hypothetical protein